MRCYITDMRPAVSLACCAMCFGLVNAVIRSQSVTYASLRLLPDIGLSGGLPSDFGASGFPLSLSVGTGPGIAKLLRQKVSTSELLKGAIESLGIPSQDTTLDVCVVTTVTACKPLESSSRVSTKLGCHRSGVNSSIAQESGMTDVQCGSVPGGKVASIPSSLWAGISPGETAVLDIVVLVSIRSLQNQLAARSIDLQMRPCRRKWLIQALSEQRMNRILSSQAATPASVRAVLEARSIEDQVLAEQSLGCLATRIAIHEVHPPAPQLLPLQLVTGGPISIDQSDLLSIEWLEALSKVQSDSQSRLLAAIQADSVTEGKHAPDTHPGQVVVRTTHITTALPPLSDLMAAATGLGSSRQSSMTTRCKRGHTVLLFSDSFTGGVGVLAWSIQKHEPAGTELLVLVPSRTILHDSEDDVSLATLIAQASPILVQRDALEWPSLNATTHELEAWAIEASRVSVAHLTHRSLLALVHIHRAIHNRYGNTGIRLIPVPIPRAQGCTLMPRLDGRIWAKLHAWRLTEFCMVALHDADQLVLTSIQTDFDAMDHICRPRCAAGSPVSTNDAPPMQCSCTRKPEWVTESPSPEARRLGPVTAFATGFLSSGAVGQLVGFMILVPSAAEYRGMLDDLRNFDKFLLCESSFLPTRFEGRSVVMDLNMPCIAETLELSHRSPFSTLQVTRSSAESHGYMLELLTGSVVRNWDSWLQGDSGTSGETRSDLQVTVLHSSRSQCRVVDFQGCKNAFKPWMARAPPITGEEACRKAASRNDLFWNVTRLWRAEALEIAQYTH